MMFNSFEVKNGKFRLILNQGFNFLVINLIAILINRYYMRFLLNNYLNVDQALVQLIKYMKWRKSIGLSKLRDSDFPIEFYALGALFQYPSDRKGNQCLYIRVKYVKRVPEIMEVLKLFFIHRMRQIDEQSQGYGWVLIFDFNGATISNCDLEFVNFLINAMCEVSFRS